jgi:hypothetical protein
MLDMLRLLAAAAVGAAAGERGSTEGQNIRLVVVLVRVVTGEEMVEEVAGVVGTVLEWGRSGTVQSGLM